MKHYESVWITDDGAIFKTEREARRHDYYQKSEKEIFEFVKNLNKLNLIEWEQVPLIAKELIQNRKELIYLLKELDNGKYI